MPKDKKPVRGKSNLVEEAPRQPFTKVSDAANAASPHPLHRTVSRVEKALERIAGQDSREEAMLENIEEWKKCVRGIASSTHGQYFLKVMNRHSGAFAPPTPENATKVVLNAAKQEFYFKFVRPYLEATHKGEIE